MTRDRLVLRGGTIITMDPQLGTLLWGDVLLTSSPRLKPGDSNPFMLREQLFGGGAVIPRGFLLVPASVSLQHPRVLQLLGRR